MSDTPRYDALRDKAISKPLEHQQLDVWDALKAAELDVAALRGQMSDAITWTMYKQRAEKAEAELADARKGISETVRERDEAQAHRRMLLDTDLTARTMRDQEAEIMRLGSYAEGLADALQGMLDAYVPDDHPAQPHREGCPACEARAALAKNPSPVGDAGIAPPANGAASARAPVASTGPVGLGPCTRCDGTGFSTRPDGRWYFAPCGVCGGSGRAALTKSPVESVRGDETSRISPRDLGRHLHFYAEEEANPARKNVLAQASEVLLCPGPDAGGTGVVGQDAEYVAQLEEALFAVECAALACIGTHGRRDEGGLTGWSRKEYDRIWTLGKVNRRRDAIAERNAARAESCGTSQYPTGDK